MVPLFSPLRAGLALVTLMVVLISHNTGHANSNMLAAAEDPAPARVVLTDGSVIYADEIDIGDGAANITNDLFGDINVNRSGILSCHLVNIGACGWRRAPFR